MGRNVFTIGNKYGTLGKGKPSKCRGVKHPPDCNHCRAVRTGDNSTHNAAWQAAFHRRRRLRKFGLTQEAYDLLIRSQNGRCAICKNPPGKPWFTLAIDHDHETGEVRGLLCGTCNTRLGFLERRWDEIFQYLKKDQP